MAYNETAAAKCQVGSDIETTMSYIIETWSGSPRKARRIHETEEKTWKHKTGTIPSAASETARLGGPSASSSDFESNMISIKYSTDERDQVRSAKSHPDPVKPVPPLASQNRPLHATSLTGRLRSGEMNAIMTNFDIDTGNRPASRNWEGLSELDQALLENRLMEYRIKKSWADPWARSLTIAVLVVTAAGFS